MAEKPQIRKNELEVFAAQITPASIDVKERRVEMIWYTGVTVPRYSWTEGAYNLVLSMDPRHVKLDRLNSGAPILNNHGDWDGVEGQLGVVERGWLEDGKGKAVARFSTRQDAKLEGVWHDIETGILRNLSVGAAIYHKKDITKEGEALKTYLATSWEPLEISVVPIPADAGAGFLRFEHNSVEADAATICLKQQEEVEQMENETIDVLALQAKAMEAERLRACTINERVRAAGLEQVVADKLIADGVTVEQASEAVITTLVSRQPVIRSVNATITRDASDTFRAAMAEMLLSRYDTRLFPLTERAREYGGLSSLLDVCRECLQLQGIRWRSLSKQKIVELALQGTSDFPYILAGAANKSLARGYEMAPRTFMPFCRQVSVADFKTHYTMKLGEGSALQLVNESGEFKYGKISESMESYAAKTYGIILALTRQAIINDDLDAFTRIPQMQGAQAARMENVIVWGLINTNGNMTDGTAVFVAGHGNLATVAAVISDANMQIGRLAMSVQTGLDGSLLNITPRYLLTPVAKSMVAFQYCSSSYNPITAATTSPFAPGGPVPLIVIAEPLLDATSATAWYLVADPALIDTIEYAYLEGQTAPYLETRTGFEIDGMEFKVRHDFGAGIVEHRGMWKNAGV